MHKFPYNWKLSDGYPATGIKKNNYKVFSCFACGGGSTMGYKLAGFEVLGCNEIDPKMMACYKENNNPKYSFLEQIQEFKKRKDLPKELYNLDILDGSPPCSNFSMAGNREKDWGKKKKFREGQAEQVLDTLFFDFIDLAKELQPKIVIAENVKGLLLGDAQKYVVNILKAFDEARYYVGFHLLNASKMGVPQRRERVFFIAVRKDLNLHKQKGFFKIVPDIKLRFNEKKIILKEFITTTEKKENQNYSINRFGDVMCNINDICPTIATDINRYWITENSLISNNSLLKIGSYPTDYNFLKNKPQYLVGMSVPPVMMANIATEIKEQLLDKINK